ncbi:hypothetical protein QQM39_03420 [Streptomyces sp. DT2A-34]|uniref:hypothetical protein n=1 Tax=Streptomyces sp. DT2A-34 TaxID=3051182 RepID=UPI00265C10BF|nr:hypothetical protein [Streptomyces sp. DT2A-34]MDO0909944.1 hypothetical protein [Streptomyces sp. DT2A-34]
MSLDRKSDGPALCDRATHTECRPLARALLIGSITASARTVIGWLLELIHS